MYLALRRRCRNALERLSRRRNYARRCEINFLPLVHLGNDGVSPRPLPHHHHHHPQHQRPTGGDSPEGVVVDPVPVNHLECRSLLAGFARCPDVVAVNETGPVCNPLRDNTRRCATTHALVRSSCRMLEVCDQAVLLSGGWNRHISGLHSLQNVERMYTMLRAHGFLRRNIKIFFANGADPLQVGSEPPQKVYPASMKMAMRNHLRRLCLQPHCVDSLFLFLNSPARSDGSSLLWDANDNGLAEEDERYTVRELMDDLGDCGARQVVLLVDQSFSGELVQELRQSPAHSNVLVFANGKSNEYSYDNEYSRYWAAANHSHTCSVDVHSVSPYL
ncbi:hypothetical protein C0Q70_10431 [Pomacea canaliculata]|uniref:Uncharacterized protein n=1 Tax=Pomacea canaliculata TaxID=400727 RepID=A0A2T7PCK4_POMCA|nr:hypothetical protein C0Q70_10431 [Pomacea canaliculata]